MISLLTGDIAPPQQDIINLISTPEVQKEESKELQYTVLKGDNLTKIAEKHQTTVLRLWNKNTSLTNQDRLDVGQILIIPSVDEVLAERPLYTLPVQEKATVGAQNGSNGLNGYDYPSCTGHVALKRYVPAGWGNATDWKYNAERAGWTVSATPVNGAIGWVYGHVVYSERVEGNRVLISENNYDWNGSTRTIWVDATDYIWIYE